MLGFCCVEVKPLGPDHAYVPPPVELNCTNEPTHAMDGVADALPVGVELTTTLTLAVAEHPLTLVTVTLYKPL